MVNTHMYNHKSRITQTVKKEIITVEGTSFVQEVSLCLTHSFLTNFEPYPKGHIWECKNNYTHKNKIMQSSSILVTVHKNVPKPTAGSLK